MTEQPAAYKKIIGNLKDFHNELQALRYAARENLKQAGNSDVETQCDLSLEKAAITFTIHTVTKGQVVYFGYWCNNQLSVSGYQYDNPPGLIQHLIHMGFEYEEPYLYYGKTAQ